MATQPAVRVTFPQGGTPSTTTIDGDDFAVDPANGGLVVLKVGAHVAEFRDWIYAQIVQITT